MHDFDAIGFFSASSIYRLPLGVMIYVFIDCLFGQILCESIQYNFETELDWSGNEE